MKIYFSLLLSFISILNYSQTIGLLQHTNESYDEGYVLFAPIGSFKTYLIDKCGNELHSWTSTHKPGQAVYLLENGQLLHTGNANNTTFNAGGKGGIIELFNWDGSLDWSYTLSNTTACQHHDVKALPNGNVLVIAWELKTNTEAIQAGRNPTLTPANVWSEQILELHPESNNTATVVWEWHLWDHMVQDFDNSKNNFGSVNTHPERVNANFEASANSSDWIHFNSIDYNEQLDQIVVSSHSFSEIWIIDHSTTTAEASGHSGGNANKGGDLLYRWGNPQAYNQGDANSQIFFGQHNAHWVAQPSMYANDIMVFNNGLNRPDGNYSTVEVIHPGLTGYTYDPNLPYLPSTSTFLYNQGNPNNYYAQNISSAQELPNGNILLCNGPSGLFSEVNTNGESVWQYMNPVTVTGILAQGATPAQNQVFRASYYPQTFAGFPTTPLSPLDILEDTNSLSAACSTNTLVQNETLENSLVVFPNPAESKITISLPFSHSTYSIFNSQGQLVHSATAPQNSINVQLYNWPKGAYEIRITTEEGNFLNRKFIII